MTRSPISAAHTQARRSTSALFASCISLVLIVACGGSTPVSSSQPTATAVPAGTAIAGKSVAADPKLHDLLPNEYKTRGTLIAVSSAASPPRAFTDDKSQIVGAIPDIVAAAAARLGLKLDLQLAQFSAQVPGVQASKYDITTDTGDFATRREALDLIDYYRAGVAIFVKTGNPKNIQGLADFCGNSVAVTKGASQEKFAQDQSTTCVSQGKKPVDILSLDTELTVPLDAGRVDAAYDNTSTALLVTTEHPEKFAMAGEAQWLAPLAFGVRKDNTQFRDVLVKALQSLIDDGTYGAVLDKWGQGICAVPRIEVNASPF